MISPQGKEIVLLCEKKLQLQNRAEELTYSAIQLIKDLKLISDEQFTLLNNMKDIDLKIQYLTLKL